MELSSLIELFLGSEIEKFLSSRKNINLGDKLTGRVIEIKEDGKVLIDFLKFRTIAKVKFPVKVGEKISVSVVEKGENIKFSLENNKSQIINSKEIINSIKNQSAGDIKKLVSFLNEIIDTKEVINKNVKANIIENQIIEKTNKDFSMKDKKGVINQEIAIPRETKIVENIFKMDDMPTKVKDIVKVLNTQFKPFGPAEDILKISSRLKALIENSGVFFEKNIASILEKIENISNIINSKVSTSNNKDVKNVIQNDLKPNLLILKEFFNEEIKLSGGKNKQLTPIRDSIEELINNIGKQQDTAVKRNQNLDATQYFTFQIPLKDKGKAKLRVYYNKKDKRDASSRGFNLSLLLIMENLGEIRTDFFLLKKDLNITFYVMDEDIRKKVSEKLGTIRDLLSNIFRFLNMSVIVSKRKIRQFDIEEIQGEEIKMGMVDLSV